MAESFFLNALYHYQTVRKYRLLIIYRKKAKIEFHPKNFYLNEGDLYLDIQVHRLSVTNFRHLASAAPLSDFDSWPGKQKV